MAIHIQDEETDWLIRDFARSRGVGITAAVKIAVQEARSREGSASDDLARKLEPMLKEIRQRKAALGIAGDSVGSDSEKAFFDEMWGEPSGAEQPPKLG